MSKRSHNGTLENSSKKLNFNMWKNNEIPPTPPSTPTTSINKYDFNIWKSKNENVEEPISICDLSVGVCMHRPLRFRVSFKSTKRETKNGDMFVFHAMESDREIQITVFPQQTAKFFDVVKFNQTYELTNFNAKKESKDFPIFIGDGIYLSLLTDSIIKEVDDGSVPQLKFNFLKIDAIKSLESNSKCDCLAVIAENWGQQIVGQNKLKRDLSLTDKSKECIVVTLWGSAYEDFANTGTCVLIHNGIVNQYNGIKTISCAPNTLFWPDPQIKAANDLKLWFDEEVLKLNAE